MPTAWPDNIESQRTESPFQTNTMKHLPYSIRATRRTPVTTVHAQHVLFAVTFLPLVGIVAYIAARLIFSIPD